MNNLITEDKKSDEIAVLGAGSWGSALALHLARLDQKVNLWSIDKNEIEAILTDKANHRYLPNIPFPANIYAKTNLADTLKNCLYVLMAVPSIGFRSTLAQIKPLINSSTTIICASKGLDAKTKKLFNQVTEEELGAIFPFAVLSGPTFAREVALGLPAALVIASKNDALCKKLKILFDSALFNIHESDDVVGVETGGIVKNVIAIAAGINDGLELGSNARSALITLGLQEIARLGSKLGARLETFMGLAGMGDLILTCSDDQSRNRRLGLALGKGKNVIEAEKEIGQVVEGKQNAQLVAELARQLQVTMPIVNLVEEILAGTKPANSIVDVLSETRA